MRRVAGAIEITDNAIHNVTQVLDELIADNDEWYDALVADHDLSSRQDKSIRNNAIRWIDPFDFRISPVLYEFVKTVWAYIDDYGKRYDRSFRSLEKVNVNRYLPGERYVVHADAGGLSTRVISALVYLNDDFTGGETEFVHFDKRVTPKAGRLVIFPSNYAYAHAALPPSDGVKYSAAFWTNA